MLCCIVEDEVLRTAVLAVLYARVVKGEGRGEVSFDY